ncbi:DUF1338 hypothetical protein [Helicosporidium sp. ATCC 50920]|nr:DUF1338 hypothetical protein [Helicosporidium sp. ATCC 50920]|eukprot:KDD74808.1 DUF1338 hypothetical protein [Helicosporidium sp. ATCC 50920]
MAQPMRSMAAAASGGVVRETVKSHMAQTLIEGILEPYWEASRTSEAVVQALESKFSEEDIVFDHFAFRTFGVAGLGIGSASRIFTDLGYTRRDALEFPAKKLRAYWFAPPNRSLPRVFVSELKVDYFIVEELSSKAQEVIARYTNEDASLMGSYGTVMGMMGCQPWPTPTLRDYELLAKESEYAAWVLAHGYALNHTTISVHSLRELKGGLSGMNELLQEMGFHLSAEGGISKISPDGLLHQSSTVADKVPYTFACGETRLIPGSYIEFAERHVLPEHKSLSASEITEEHRREGFESSNADKIFESTYVGAQRR